MPELEPERCMLGGIRMLRVHPRFETFISDWTGTVPARMKSVATQRRIRTEVLLGNPRHPLMRAVKRGEFTASDRELDDYAAYSERDGGVTRKNWDEFWQLRGYVIPDAADPRNRRFRPKHKHRQNHHGRFTV
jgi:hypothetical protein